jgi:hypothetical protein
MKLSGPKNSSPGRYTAHLGYKDMFLEEIRGKQEWWWKPV